MLKQFDNRDNTVILMEEQQIPRRYLCYASELTDQLRISEEDFDDAIERAFSACVSLNIPIKDNFKSIFRSFENYVVTDWKLSSLACYLIVINADPANPDVARAQLLFATKNFNYVNIF
jgi:hypothetical protein